MTELRLAKVTREFVFFKESLERARAVFIDGKFAFCKFTTGANPYSLADWKFLNELSAAIIKLNEKEEA